MTPSDEDECRQMLYTGFSAGNTGGRALSPPTGSDPESHRALPLRSLPIGRGRLLRQGKEIAILAFGTLLQQASRLRALDATLVDMRFVKPLDEALLAELAASHQTLVTLEEELTHR